MPVKEYNMRICKICKTQNDDKDYICKNCGSYLKLHLSGKLMMSAIICIILVPIKEIFVLLIFPALLLLILSIILQIKDCIKINNIRKQNNINIKDLQKQYLNEIKNVQKIHSTHNIYEFKKVKAFFIKNNMLKPRKSDGNIVKGDCVITFEDDTFIIIQGDETIQNNLSSIYYLDIWEYKNEIYYKFVMRSHNEYTLKSLYDEIEIISQQLAQRHIKIEDNRAEFAEDDEI
jgi:hypothetical protein